MNKMEKRRKGPRQGDISFHALKDAFKGGKKTKCFTFAYGETSGHHHTAYALEEGAYMRILQQEGLTKIEVKGKVGLVHTDRKNVDKMTVEEFMQLMRDMDERIKQGEDFHRPKMLREGVQECKNEQEYDPFLKVIRTVQD